MSEKITTKSSKISYAAAHNRASFFLEVMRSIFPLYLFYRLDHYKQTKDILKTLAHNTSEIIGKLFSNYSIINKCTTQISAQTSPYIDTNQRAFEYQAIIVLGILAALCVYHIMINSTNKEEAQNKKRTQNKISQLFESRILYTVIKIASLSFMQNKIINSDAFNAKILAAFLTKDNIMKYLSYSAKDLLYCTSQWKLTVKAMIALPAIIIIASELFALSSTQIQARRIQNCSKPSILQNDFMETKIQQENHNANWLLFSSLAATTCYLLIGWYLRSHKESSGIAFAASEIGFLAMQLIYLIYETIRYFTDIEKSNIT